MKYAKPFWRSGNLHYGNPTGYYKIRNYYAYMPTQNTVRCFKIRPKYWKLFLGYTI